MGWRETESGLLVPDTLEDAGCPLCAMCAPGLCHMHAGAAFGAAAGAGVCRECGCTDDVACETEDGPCYWADETRALCSDCVDELEDAATDYDALMRDPDEGDR